MAWQPKSEQAVERGPDGPDRGGECELTRRLFLSGIAVAPAAVALSLPGKAEAAEGASRLDRVLAARKAPTYPREAAVLAKSTKLVKDLKAAQAKMGKGKGRVPARRGPGDAKTAQFFREIQQHENDHVAFLRLVLGPFARPKPTFVDLTQPDIETFYRLTQIFENTGTGAYLGAAPFIFSRLVLAAAGSIALIEGRHSGFINTFLGDPITTNVFGDAPSFEVPLPQELVRALLSPFIVDLNGGEEPGFSLRPSLANDIRILNYALVAEFLEAEFYNINVPLFFPS